MAAYRSIQRLAISWGMVVIPVAMVKATDDSESTGFTQLCPDHPDSNVNYKKVCALHQHEVSGKPLRGYAVSKPTKTSRGQFVVIEDADLEDLPLPTAHIIQIEEFVDATEIDGLYPDGAYFLVPEDVGVPAYNILRAAIAESGRVGIGKYAMRGKEHFCCIEEYAGVILLTPMHYPSEIRDVANLGVPVLDVNPAQMAMGLKLIEASTKEWDPSKYHNEAAAALREVVAAKLAGTTVPVAKPRPQAAHEDLMAVLAASVEAATKSKPAAKAKGKGKAA